MDKCTIGEGNGDLCPPVIVGKIRAGEYHQLIRLNGATKINGNFRILLPINAPGLVRPNTVAAVFAHTVNSIAGKEFRLSPGLHIGRCVGIQIFDIVLVADISAQIAVSINFLRERLPHIQIMELPSK